MNKIIKEYVLRDGIGAQISRKIHAMCYAKEMGYLFEDTPIDDFFNHPSDNINTAEDKEIFIKKFSSLIKNPWSDINFNKLENKEYMNEIDRNGRPISYSTNYIRHSHNFSNIDPKNISNEIVFHIRRGNVLPNNPRWISEDIYIKMINLVPKIKDKLGIAELDVTIMTDSYDNDIHFINGNEKDYWQQPFLIDPNMPKFKGAQYSFKMSKINEESFQNLGIKVNILKNLDTYESFLRMCNAKILVTSESAFNRAAAYLNKSYILGWKDIHDIQRPNNFIGHFNVDFSDIVII